MVPHHQNTPFHILRSLVAHPSLCNNPLTFLRSFSQDRENNLSGRDPTTGRENPTGTSNNIKSVKPSNIERRTDGRRAAVVHGTHGKTPTNGCIPGIQGVGAYRAYTTLGIQGGSLRNISPPCCTHPGMPPCCTHPGMPPCCTHPGYTSRTACFLPYYRGVEQS